MVNLRFRDEKKELLFQEKERQMAKSGVRTYALTVLAYSSMTFLRDFATGQLDPDEFTTIATLVLFHTLMIFIRNRYSQFARWAIALSLDIWLVVVLLDGDDMHSLTSIIVFNVLLVICITVVVRSTRLNAFYLLITIPAYVAALIVKVPAVQIESHVVDDFVFVIPSALFWIGSYIYACAAYEHERRQSFAAELKLSQRAKDQKEIFQKLAQGLVIMGGNKPIWYNLESSKIFGLNNDLDQLVEFHNWISSDDGISLGDWVQLAAHLVHPGYQCQTKEFYDQQGRGNSKAHVIVIKSMLIEWDNQDRLMLFIKDISAEREISSFRSRWISTISHEFKTPLNVILNMTNYLEEITQEDEGRSYLQVTRSATELLLCHIGDLLDYSLIQSKDLRLNLGQFDVTATVHKTIELLTEAARDKEQDINVDLSQLSRSPHIINDDFRLQKIVLNLLTNAIKFTPRQGDITVKLFQEDQLESEPDFIYLEVSDSGIGIAEENMKFLFREFGKVNTPESERMNPRGVGLGLWISNNIATHIGLPLEVSSEEGQGTRFTLAILVDRADHHSIVSERQISTELMLFRNLKAPIESHRSPNMTDRSSEGRGMLQLSPDGDGAQDLQKTQLSENFQVALIDEIEEEAQDSSAKPGYFGLLSSDMPSFEEILVARSIKSEPNPVGTCQKCPQILVVDGNHLDRFLLNSFCKRLKLKLDVATHGLQALNMVSDRLTHKGEVVHCECYQLILVDYHMPEMLGCDCISKVREIEKLTAVSKQCFVVGYSTVATDNEIQAMLESGADDVTTKPLSLKKFSQLVCHVGL